MNLNSGNNDQAKELAVMAEIIVSQVSNNAKIRIYSQLGFIYIKMGEFNKSIEHSNHGIGLVIKEKGEKSSELTTLYHNLGRAYMLKNDYSNALSALNKSKDLQLELNGEVMQRTADYIKECQTK